MFAGLTNNHFKLCEKTVPVAIVGRSDFHVPTRRIPKKFRVRVILNSHNQEHIIGETVAWYRSQEVEVHVIDDSSENATYDILQKLAKNDKKVTVEQLPEVSKSGSVQTKMRAHKKRLVSNWKDVDWVMDADADEVRESPWRQLNLREAFYAVELMGFNAVDFTVLHFWDLEKEWKEFSSRKVARFLDNDKAIRLSFDVAGKVSDFCVPQRAKSFAQVQAWKQPKEEEKVFPFNFLMKRFQMDATAKNQKQLKVALSHFDSREYDQTFLVERLSGVGYARNSKCSVGSC
jgi:glycosyltransferase involved in cell wall biosynthesis